MSNDMRGLTEIERLILEKLISAVPVYYATLKNQIDSCLVKICDEYGSLRV